MPQRRLRCETRSLQLLRRTTTESQTMTTPRTLRHVAVALTLVAVAQPAGAFAPVPLPESSTLALIAGGITAVIVLARIWRKK